MPSGSGDGPDRTGEDFCDMSTTLRKLGCFAVLMMAGTALSACSDDSTGVGDSQAVTEAPGVFETFVGQDDQWYFHLLAGNGQRVLRSEGYVSRAGCLNGVESVKDNGVDLGQYEVLGSVDGEHYFNLLAANYEIIGTSETYVSRFNAERGVDTVHDLIVRNLRVEAADTGGASFNLFTGADGEWYFNLRAANGEIVLQSEGYVQRAGAENGIASVRDNGKLAEQYEIREAQNGQHYFVLKAQNHELIGRGEMYASLSNAERGVEALVELLQSERVADPE